MYAQIQVKNVPIKDSLAQGPDVFVLKHGLQLSLVSQTCVSALKKGIEKNIVHMRLQVLKERLQWTYFIAFICTILGLITYHSKGVPDHVTKAAASEHMDSAQDPGEQSPTQSRNGNAVPWRPHAAEFQFEKVEFISSEFRSLFHLKCRLVGAATGPVTEKLCPGSRLRCVGVRSMVP
jgi:hypothetical protein